MTLCVNEGAEGPLMDMSGFEKQLKAIMAVISDEMPNLSEASRLALALKVSNRLMHEGQDITSPGIGMASPFA